MTFQTPSLIERLEPVTTGDAGRFADETWHLNAFNMCEVIVIRDGPDAQGRRYLDGRHQIRVALFERIEDAKEAVELHNRERIWGMSDK